MSDIEMLIVVFQDDKLTCFSERHHFLNNCCSVLADGEISSSWEIIEDDRLQIKISSPKFPPEQGPMLFRQFKLGQTIIQHGVRIDTMKVFRDNELLIEETFYNKRR